MAASLSLAASSPTGFDYEAALVRCAHGEQRALKELYDQEASRLLGVALRIVRRREVANEVVHDAFLQIWQKAGTFDSARGSGRGWIYTVVRHRALNTIRDDARETELDSEAIEQIPDSADDPLASLERLSSEHAIRRCLDSLDDAKRTSVMLAFVDGYTHEQVAERLATPLGTVKSWIRRGLAALKACLE